MTERRVRLALPADPRYGRLARVTAASLASRARFPYDDVEDLRIVVDEMIILLFYSIGPNAAIDLSYLLSDDTIEVVADASGSVTSDPSELDIPEEIQNRFLQLVAGLVDTVEIDLTERRIRIVKHSTRPDTPDSGDSPDDEAAA